MRCMRDVQVAKVVPSLWAFLLHPNLLIVVVFVGSGK